MKKGQWDDLVETFNRAISGNATVEELRRAGDAFFDKQIAKNRRSILERGDDPVIERLKHAVLIALRECDIFLLSRGTIEAYLPESITGDDKPTRALVFCNSVRDRDAVLSLCDDVPVDNNGTTQNELEWVLSKIFNGRPTDVD